MKTWKKALSCVLALVMVVCLLPVTALAAETTVNSNLQSAIDGAASGDTIKLGVDIEESITIPAGKSIVLNLNGHTLTNSTDSDTITVALGAKLTINGTGKVDNKTHQRAAIFNNGTVVLNGGTYDRTSETGESADISGGNSWYTICNHGQMTINGGATVKNTGSFSSMIENGYYNYTSTNERLGYVAETNQANPELTINGGTFIGGLNTVKNDDGGVLTINAGSFSNTTQASVLNWNVATINGGTFEVTAAGCNAVLNGASESGSTSVDKGSLTINGGTFTSLATPIQNNFNDQKPAVTGGVFSSDISTFVDNGYGTVVLADGTTAVVVTSDSVSAVAEVGGNKYTSLQNAIDAAQAGQTVTLLADTSEDVLIAEGKDITLELNGSTWTVPSDCGIDVIGALTIQDTAGTGKIAAKGTPLYVSGTVTLQSGTIESTGDYGIHAHDGGSVVVNGGTITSYYAPLTGNNTTGDMNFTVNGGTLTAEKGPAIYMPGQMNLTITDGTLNGGISLRMGQVNISGGTINAITTGGDENIDSPAEYYYFSGNAWFPDALYVFGGTYTSQNEKYGNSLNLNITGGTFNCANGQGSAVAIYDIAKTGQPASVQISGDAVLKTDAENRKAYQVLSLADIGVDNPKTGYGNSNLEGKVDSAISGGAFSTSVEEYVVPSLNYEANNNGMYTYHTKLSDAQAAAGANGSVRQISGGGGEITDRCTVTLKNGTDEQSITFAKGETFTLDTLKRSGYYFLGWSDGTNVYQGGAEYTVEKDVTLTARWASIPGTIALGGAINGMASQVMSPFVDVTPVDYYYDAVNWAVDNGITTGTGRYSFSPDEACTRAQAVTFLWRAAGSPAPKSTATPFVDVDANAYYAKAVAWAVENGITVGTSATTFSPSDTCTRAQIVTFLYRAFGKSVSTAASFTDVAADAYYAPAVAWAAANNVTGGTGSGKFSPAATCTRAQIVTFLYRCCG